MIVTKNIITTETDNIFGKENIVCFFIVRNDRKDSWKNDNASDQISNEARSKYEFVMKYSNSNIKLK